MNELPPDEYVEVWSNTEIVSHDVTTNPSRSSTVLSAVISNLLAGSMSHDMILERYLDRIIDVTDCDIGCIYHSPGGITSLSVKTGVVHQNSILLKCSRKFFDGAGITIIHDPVLNVRSMIKIPLLCNSKPGVLFLYRLTKEWSIEDIQLVTEYIDVCRILYCNSSTHKKFEQTVVKKIELNESRDLFFSTLSHELRTPLNGIMGMISMLPDAGPLNAKQSEYVTVLAECAVRLTHILNNILDFSKMTSDKLVLNNNSLTIEKVVDDSIKITEGRIREKSIELTFDISPDIPAMIGDDQRIIQILSNLLSNAGKFTDRNGSIQILVTAFKVSETLDIGNKWKISFTVQDTGIGIPSDEQEKIFNIFNQASTLSVYQSRSGTGLGLSIARELVRLMGGEIKVSSSGIPGEGSAFSFYIILEEDSSPFTDQLHSFTGTRVLVVDDRQEIRLQLLDMLFEWGCIPQAVESAVEAIKYIEHSEFDVCLVDIFMPAMSGIQLAQAVRYSHPNLPMIGISSGEIQGGEDYFDYYMYKPIKKSELGRAIAGCLKTGRINSPKRTQKTRNDLNIVIAEDDYHNIFTLREMLINLGFNEDKILVTLNGQECVNLVEESSVHIDVCLVDLVMPIKDGVECAKALKQLNNPPLIIIVSAAVQAADKARCQRAHVDGYISKPITKSELESTLMPLLLTGNKMANLTEVNHHLENLSHKLSN